MRAVGVVVAAGLAVGCGGLSVSLGTPAEECPAAVHVVGPVTEFAVAQTPAVSLDQLDARYRAAERINNLFEKDRAIKQLAADAARSGDATDRVRLAAFVTRCADGVNNLFEKDAARKECARAFAARGMAAEATELAGGINNLHERDQALKQIAAGKR